MARLNAEWQNNFNIECEGWLYDEYNNKLETPFPLTSQQVGWAASTEARYVTYKMYTSLHGYWSAPTRPNRLDGYDWLPFPLNPSLDRTLNPTPGPLPDPPEGEGTFAEETSFFIEWRQFYYHLYAQKYSESAPRFSGRFSRYRLPSAFPEGGFLSPLFHFRCDECNHEGIISNY